MPNRPLSVLLFLSSYSPVFVILALKSYGDSCPIYFLSLFLLISGLVGVVLFLLIALRHTPYSATVVDVEARDSDLAGYLVTYLLPFLGIAASGWRDVLAVALFFAIVAIVYVNSRMIYINPILSLFGYHLYRVQATTRPDLEDTSRITPQFLVTKSRWVRRGDRLTVRRVMADALIELSADGGHDAKRKG